MENEVELRWIFSVLRRWAWLLVLGIALGTAGGYGVSLYQTPIYRASTKVLFMRAPEDQSSDISIFADKQLAQTFTELLVTSPVQKATSETLGYEVSGDNIDVQQVGDAQLIQVTVDDSDPQHAADIANTMVKVFLEQNEALQASRFNSSEESLQAQLQQVENQITGLENQLSESLVESFDSQIQEVTRTISDLQAEIQSLSLIHI